MRKHFSFFIPVSLFLFPYSFFAQQNSVMDHPTWDKMESIDSSLHWNIKPFDISRKGRKHIKNFEFNPPPFTATAGYEVKDKKVLHQLGGGIRLRGNFQKQKLFVEINLLGYTPSASPSYQDSLMKYTWPKNVLPPRAP